MRTRGFRLQAAAILVAMLTATGSPASAQQPDGVHPTDVQKCEGNAPAAPRATACAALLASGKLSAKEQGLAHFFLGLARLDLAQPDDSIGEFRAAATADPSLWYADWMLAEILVGRRQYDEAIAAWTKVVDANPTMTAAYEHRASAFDYAGRHADGVADYTKAIQVATERDSVAELYAHRGVAKEASHLWAAARADFDEAIKRDAQLEMAYFGRGRVAFLSGDDAGAIADLAKAEALRPADDIYDALWLFLAEQRAGKDATGDLRRRSSTMDQKQWPWPIVQVFLGDIAENDIKMPERKMPWDGLRDTCERDFYMAELAANRGDRAKAKALLHTAIDTKITEYIEYNAALSELERLSR